jgi:phosphonate transport system substrate-binding protein
MGHTFDYFEEIVQAGAHQTALRMLLEGDVAGAAIDSTVLEAEAREQPELLEKVRAVAVLGPSPAPPWVFSPNVSYETRAQVTRCLADMHRDRYGRAVLASWGIQELRVVSDDFYDPIRCMTTAPSCLVRSAAIHARP